MHRGFLVSSLAVLIAIAPVGCTWVALTPEAESVRVVPPEATAACERVGSTKARTKASVGIFPRSDEKVAEELETLARNDAPELGGNTVVAEGPVDEEGVQRFGIYACPTGMDPTR
jgi:hypothetical protein